MRSGGGVLLISALELVCAASVTIVNQPARAADASGVPTGASGVPGRTRQDTAGQINQSLTQCSFLLVQIVGVVLLGVFEGFKSHYFAGMWGLSRS